MRRVIGLDIHRTFAEAVAWDDGRLIRLGRLDMTRTALEGFGKSLRPSDEVVVEATGNAMAVVRVLSPFVARVIVANPLQVKAIAHAHVKTDKIDAGVLASLHAAGFLPEVWTPDPETERLRRLVARRNQVVRHRTRIKNEVHSILHAHLIPRCPHADLFNRRGRDWLSRQPLPVDEKATIDRHVRELDRLAEDLDVLDREVAQGAIGNPSIERLITITGVNLTVAAGLVAAIGDDPPLYLAAEARELCRAEPACSSIRAWSRPARPHQQGRTQPCARDVGGGRLGCREGARTASRVLRPHSGSAWPPGRRRGGGSQVGRPVLAPSHEGNGLSLGATRAGGHQEAKHGAPGRSAGQEGESTRSGLCLQRQGTQESGDARRDPGRAGLRALRRPMAAARTRQGSARAPQSGQARMIRRPDEASSRRPALRREVARADEK